MVGQLPYACHAQVIEERHARGGLLLTSHKVHNAVVITEIILVVNVQFTLQHEVWCREFS